MTTESRMREALEKAERKLFPDGIPQFIDKAALGLFASVAMEILLSEALSPPARGTSYAWGAYKGITLSVEWDEHKEQWTICGDDHLSDYHVINSLCAQVATLANLTPPEEKA